MFIDFYLNHNLNKIYLFLILENYMYKKRVLISNIEAGQGHLVTAQAIQEQLQKKYSDEIDVIVLKYKESGLKEFKDFENFCVGEVHKANKHKSRLFTQMILMHSIGAQNTLKLSYNLKFAKYKSKVIQEYAKYNPDLILTTYYGDLHCLCCGKAQGKIKSIVSAYNPDHNTHGWWDRRVDLFMCNNAFASDEAIKKIKINPQNVKTVNFMSRSSLKEITGDKKFYRKKYNLPLDKFTVILADGAYGVARMEEYTDILLKTKLPITLIPVCGKNQKLLEKYEHLKDSLPQNITLMPQPFVSYISELYKASDLFITKSGPNAITDCTYMGTPIMTNFYTGPIEKASCKLFTEYFKTGIHCPNANKAKELVESYIKSPSLLNEYIKNTSNLDINKNGAEECADIIAEALGIPKK